MGLFSRSRTTTTTESTSLVETKIIKLSYLQTLAIANNLTSAKDLAGETKSSVIKLSSGNTSKSANADFVDKYGSLLKSAPAKITGMLLGGGILGPLLAGSVFKAVGSLFGSKRSTSQTITTNDSGWSMVKSWNQPQFDIIRYAIGIKELSVSQFTYEATSEIISIPWTSPKEIVKVVLYVDQFIPNVFPSGGQYIEYYVRADYEGAEWIRINGIGLPTIFNSNGTIVPRVISFNTERPVSSAVEQAYITTPSPVKSLRFKAILKRPTQLSNSAPADSYSPILKSYKLIMTPRGGL